MASHYPVKGLDVLFAPQPQSPSARSELVMSGGDGIMLLVNREKVVEHCGQIGFDPSAELFRITVTFAHGDAAQPNAFFEGVKLCLRRSVLGFETSGIGGLDQFCQIGGIPKVEISVARLRRFVEHAMEDLK